jgi:NAD(P)-dependent dehydrogenase (short-subunit alcohol dehydrogenase family)
MMRNLALEWGRYGIRCNSIVPGPIADTEGMRRLGGEIGEGAFRKSIPLGRYDTAEEIGYAAVFLASPLAAYVSGTVLVMDGGQNLAGSQGFAAAIEAMQAQPR